MTKISLHNTTGGVKPMNIAGRIVRERERTAIPMTAEERAWRKKWLKDQTLTSNEPRVLPLNRKELYNPIRRFYQWPLNAVEKMITPAIGKDAAGVFRLYSGRFLMGIYGILGAFYYFKYNTNTWESKSGWRVVKSKEACYPGDPGYPKVNPEKPPHDYYDRGFKKSIFAKNYPQYNKEKPCE